MVLSPFSTTAKTQVALINVVQVYCYEDTKIIKTFPHILKVRPAALSYLAHC